MIIKTFFTFYQQFICKNEFEKLYIQTRAAPDCYVSGAGSLWIKMQFDARLMKHKTQTENK